MTGDIARFEGDWGSLVAAATPYGGYQPIETDTDILVMLGGPLLTFDQPKEPTDAAERKTRAILHRLQAGKMNWTEDLNGPFLVLHVNKRDRTVTSVTDLMMFIPFYHHLVGDDLMIGSHVDALARAAEQTQQIDFISVSDFLRHQVITHPFTLYEAVRQGDASSIHSFIPDPSRGCRLQQETYWRPTEEPPPDSFAETAHRLRDALQRYIEGVTGEAQTIAQFLSAGEDSRVIASLLRAHPRHDGLIFLDRMNREGQLAEQIASIYQVNMKPMFRDADHYYRMLGSASSLVGSGLPYVHAHCVGLDQAANLSRYDAVFGGFLADTLLKSKPRPKRKARRKEHLPALPRYLLPGYREATWTYAHPWLAHDQLLVAEERRRAHWQRIVEWRPTSAHQWFYLYPSSMRSTLGYFHSNRRLFRSYEPFMCHEVVRISASVPESWKAGRRLFHRAFRDDLRSAATVIHPKGHYPHRPHWANLIMRPVTRLQRSLRKSVGTDQGNQGPWGDWAHIRQQCPWEQDLQRRANDHSLIENPGGEHLREAIRTGKLTMQESLRLHQLLVCSKI